MRTVAPLLLSAWACLAAGCAQNPYLAQGQMQAVQQQQLAMMQQTQKLQERANALDRDNQELQTLLAQEKQMGQVKEEQLAALQDQMASVADQLSQSKNNLNETQKMAQTLAASARKRASAGIKANNSLDQGLPALTIPGAEVRRDGDVLRIELPSKQLFQEGTAQLRPEAGKLIDLAAGEIERQFPSRAIGVEGHTDTTWVRAGGWAGNHQLSVAQALAVYDYLSMHTRLRREQLSIAGHGPNHPVVSNATPSGRERNRRIELVIYPDEVGRR